MSLPLPVPMLQQMIAGRACGVLANLSSSDFAARVMHLDSRLFHLVNSTLACAPLDIVMPIITDFALWAPILLVALVRLIWGDGGRQRILAVMMILAITAADQTSSTFLKNLVQRPRPCCAETDARTLIGCKTSKSFPSSHASNTAAVAAVVITRCGWATGWPVLVISATVGYSRVYVGVHYPFDVLYGMLLGLFLGWLTVRMTTAVVTWWGKHMPGRGVLVTICGLAFVEECAPTAAGEGPRAS